MFISNVFLLLLLLFFCFVFLCVCFILFFFFIFFFFNKREVMEGWTGFLLYHIWGLEKKKAYIDELRI